MSFNLYMSHTAISQLQYNIPATRGIIFNHLIKSFIQHVFQSFHRWKYNNVFRHFPLGIMITVCYGIYRRVD